jgi:hypothetical protein
VKIKSRVDGATVTVPQMLERIEANQVELLKALKAQP